MSDQTPETIEHQGGEGAPAPEDGRDSPIGGLHTQNSEPETEPEAPEEPQEGAEDAGEGEGSNREAAKYRRRLREAEAERDALAERVETLQRAEVERIAGGASVKPAALWASGASLPELLTEDGTVDPEKVATAVQTARDQLGLAAPRASNYVPREGATTGTRRSPDGMASVIRGGD